VRVASGAQRRAGLCKAGWTFNRFELHRIHNLYGAWSRRRVPRLCHRFPARPRRRSRCSAGIEVRSIAIEKIIGRATKQGITADFGERIDLRRGNELDRVMLVIEQQAGAGLVTN